MSNDPVASTGNSIKGKVCIVTGANCGVGQETARGIARKGGSLIIAARNAEKGRRAVEDIKRSTANPNVELLLIDLASLKSIRTAAEILLDRHERIDILINNAGLLSPRRRETANGFEMTFGVNHLGHFLLTNLLLGRIKATAALHGGARIINVSSTAHRSSPGLDFEDLMYESRPYRSFQAYCNSKLANILFTRELSRRLDGTGVIPHAVHPGLVRSRLGRQENLGMLWAGFFWVLGLFVGISPKRGAETSILVATSGEAAGSRGQYWEKTRIVQATLPENEANVSAELWRISEEFTELS